MSLRVKVRSQGRNGVVEYFNLTIIYHEVYRVTKNPVSINTNVFI